jgi:hypothetical protein
MHTTRQNILESLEISRFKSYIPGKSLVASLHSVNCRVKRFCIQERQIDRRTRAQTMFFFGLFFHAKDFANALAA